MSARRYTLWATAGHDVMAEDVVTHTYSDADGEFVKSEDYDKMCAAMKDLLAEVEYAISSATVPGTWLDEDEPDSAIVNARKLVT